MRSESHIDQDIDVIARRLHEELTAETIPADDIETILALLAPDGSLPDVDYNDRARSYWSPGIHPVRIARMAAAYRQSLFAPDEGDRLKTAILSTLTFWVNLDPQSDNWWHNCIHTPKYIGQSLLLMGDTVPPAVWDKAVDIVRRGGSGFTRTGANLTWEAGNLLVLACAIHDGDLLRQAIDALTREIRITTEEGIQPDFSFHQHGPQLYMSNYGELFSTDNSRYAVLFAGTAFALGDDKIHAISGLIREGQQWFIWGRQFDYHALGRQLDRHSATNRGGALAPICRRMAMVDPDHAAEYADFAARVTGEQAPGSSGPRGNRHYWRSDVMIHRSGCFYASVRMHSTRTFATEGYINQENLKGYHLSDGVCFLMQRGDEYHDMQPVWDWRKLPGATCRTTADPLPYGREMAKPGNTAFVGGVSDGQAGVATMDYDRDGVRARKAWFFLPDGWVALGAGVSGVTDDPVTTSINQCRLTSDVLLLHGARVATLDATQWRGDELLGVYHDGVGYYLLESQDIVVSAAPQSGTWTSIEESTPDTGIVTQDVFSLWIEHGARPSEGAYAYRVVPALPASDFATYNATSPITVLANDAKVQALVYPEEALVQAVFYAACCLTVDEGLAIEVDVPCALMLRQAQDAVTLLVADPAQSQSYIQVRLSGHYTGESCTYNPAEEITVVTVDLPTGDFAGQTVRVQLQVK